MPKLNASVGINRPIAEASAFLDDPKNHLKWESGLVVSEQTSEGPMGVGTTGRRVNQFMGRRLESTWEITEYVPPAREAFKSTSGDMSYMGSWQLETVEGGTRFTYSIDAQMSGFFWRLLDPLIAPIAQRQFRSEMNRLKEVLETEAPSS